MCGSLRSWAWSYYSLELKLRTLAIHDGLVSLVRNHRSGTSFEGLFSHFQRSDTYSFPRRTRQETNCTLNLGTHATCRKLSFSKIFSAFLQSHFTESKLIWFPIVDEHLFDISHDE